MNNTNGNTNNGAPAPSHSTAPTAAPTLTHETVIEIPTTSSRPGNQISFFDEAGAASTSTLQRNLLSILSRSQLGRQTSMPNQERHPLGGQHTDGMASPESSHDFMRVNSENGFIRPNSMGTPSSMPQQHLHRHGHGGRNARSSSWRTNLNNVFSISASTDALRSLIASTGNYRYSPLNTDAMSSPRNDTMHLLQNTDDQHSFTNNHHHGDAGTINPRMSRSLQENVIAANNEGGPSLSTTTEAESLNDSHRPELARQISNRSGQQQHPAAPPTAAGAAADHEVGGDDMEGENYIIWDICLQMLGHIVRYMPFMCILLLKFMHDHFLGILDILWLHAVMFHANKSLRQQVAKLSQRNYAILLRDLVLVLLLVAYRLAVCSVPPDPFGLLVNIPDSIPSYEVVYTKIPSTPNTDYFKGVATVNGNVDVATPLLVGAAATEQLVDKVQITKSKPLGVLLYYVAVNDLVLKLLTICIKLTVTFLPTKVMRHKSRARLYVLIEYTSQFYRALAPARQWSIYLVEYYSGLEAISGIIFLVLYIAAKLFELAERGKSLKRALMNYIQNMDYERKPTKDELDAAGSVCPICHDAYNSPVILNCSHIFCDDCVSTWFKREQTCPMCRAMVSDDPKWQDGSTTLFYQLC